ncbi:hypothetical protein CC78DRAFT_576824 [Lojkania enalia]|uniref:Uncharacterized protein n=1 Tax=Lojkania enalia TaxID=147567 RepID=A0A9P4KHH0_9PLEO|nr:hypothetical protein CC78DRAFT_576824 [Didymosphaeria enalia]
MFKVPLLSKIMPLLGHSLSVEAHSPLSLSIHFSSSSSSTPSARVRPPSLPGVDFSHNSLEFNDLGWFFANPDATTVTLPDMLDVFSPARNDIARTDLLHL